MAAPKFGTVSAIDQLGGCLESLAGNRKQL
jgi:hypothetical protein